MYIIDKERNVNSHFDEDEFPESHIIKENQFQSEKFFEGYFVVL